MSTFDRAAGIVAALNGAGIRATTDPGAASPPCVLVVPPARTYDLPCGFTARWQLAAIAPAALGADRNSWAQLEALVDAVADVVDLQGAELVTYTLNGTGYPAFLLTFEEVI